MVRAEVPFPSYLLCCSCTLTAAAQVQTPTQRRANAKFAKEQESRMGKSNDQLKKRAKETAKSPISPIWIG